MNSKAYYQANKERKKEYYQANKDKRKAYVKKNKDKIKKYDQKYRKNNKDKIKKYRTKYRTKYYRERRKSDPIFRLVDNIKTRIRGAVKSQSTSKSSSSFKLLGCTAKEAYDYIESLFKEGMSWDNYGEWEIDHIRPCASFDLTKESEQLLCFNYKNLQPLWWEENRSKSDKY